MSEKIEYVEVTVKVPRKIFDFLKDLEKPMNMTVKEYIEHSIIQDVFSDMDCTAGGGGPFFDPDELIKRYELKPIFQKHGIQDP